MGTELPLFFASTTRAPHLFLLLPLIFHSFNNYQLSPTVCRHCDKHGYTCSILSLPHLFPFLSFLLHASQSLSFHQLLASPTSSFMLLFQLELRGRGPTPISSPGAGGWVEPLGGDRAQGALRAQSEQQCGLQTKQMHPTPPPHPSGLNIHTAYPYPIINQKKDRNIPPPPRYASVTSLSV